jgi:HopA1 effector protein family
MNTSEVLQHLAQHLLIDENFTLRLPDSPDFTAPAPVIQRLQANSRDLQAGFLEDHLQHYLYNRYFSGCRESDTVEDQSFANDSAGSTNSEFYGKLDQANPGAGYYDWNWTIAQRAVPPPPQDLLTDNWIEVVKDGLHLRMPPTHVHPPEARNTGDLVAIAMPKNLLTVDRYIAVGDRGRPQGSPITNIYFNCPAATAIDLLSKLAIDLNQKALPFELAVLFDEEDYERSDSVILRLDRSAYPLAKALLQSVYEEMGAAWRLAVPLGTKPLGIGVAVAETNNLEQDFGRSFWGAVARGLAAAWQEDLNRTEQRWAAIQDNLHQASIDFTYPYLIEAEDIYDFWLTVKK